MHFDKVVTCLIEDRFMNMDAGNLNINYLNYVLESWIDLMIGQQIKVMTPMLCHKSIFISGISPFARKWFVRLLTMLMISITIVKWSPHVLKIFNIDRWFKQIEPKGTKNVRVTISEKKTIFTINALSPHCTKWYRISVHLADVRPYRSELWHESRQRCCRGACQISERLEVS